MRRSFAASSALVLMLLALLGGLAGAEVTQKGGLRVKTSATMSPRALPREGSAPISVSVEGRISTVGETRAPQLRKLEIAINRHGRLDLAGLRVCPLARIQPATESRALAACGPSLVGRGKFAGTLTLPGSTPYPIEGPLLVFDGREHGSPVLLAHIYSAEPFATSFVIVFRVLALPHGSFGTLLSADLATELGDKRTLTSIEMTLSRRWSSGGTTHSFLSAGCPAPEGFGQAVFPLARTTFSFAGGARFDSTLSGECRVRR